MGSQDFAKSIDCARNSLRESENNGFWPYVRGAQEPSAEATSWCAIALRDDAGVSARVIDFLVSSQGQDGGWSTAPDAGKPDWTSSLCLLALRVLENGSALAASPDSQLKGKARSSINRGIDYLLNHRAAYQDPFDWISLLLKGAPVVLPFGPNGWPWNPGCYHWVEPTSYALLALKHSRVDNGEQVAEAISGANDFLIENACKGGGWNHGNHTSLGVNQPPYPVTTAEALLALQDMPENATVKSGMDFLSSRADSLDSAMSLSLYILCGDALGWDTGPQAEKLAARQKKDGSFSNSLLLTALASCALETTAGTNLLKLPRQQHPA